MKQKTKINVMYLCLAFFLSVSSCADNKSGFNDNKRIASAEIKVWGNCEMCQEAIEESLQANGIARASWDSETKVLSVSFDTTLVGLDDIHKKVAAAGYDTEKYKASDESYRNLHECCQYERRP